MQLMYNINVKINERICSEMKLRSTLTIDDLKLADKAIRLMPDYQSSGINGYLRDVVKQLRSKKASDIVLANPGAKYEEKYMDLKKNYGDFHFENKSQTQYTVKFDPSTEEYMKNTQYQLMQETFWNFDRLFDYILIQVLTGVEDTFKLPIDENTSDVFDDMLAFSEAQELQNDSEFQQPDDDEDDWKN